jgi:hypothetical protein
VGAQEEEYTGIETKFWSLVMLFENCIRVNAKIKSAKYPFENSSVLW